MSALDTPVTFGDLLDAIEGCGIAFGKALDIALVETGADQGQRLRIAKALDALATDGGRESPEAQALTAITAGLLTRLL